MIRWRDTNHRSFTSCCTVLVKRADLKRLSAQEYEMIREGLKQYQPGMKPLTILSFFLQKSVFEIGCIDVESM